MQIARQVIMTYYGIKNLTSFFYNYFLGWSDQALPLVKAIRLQCFIIIIKQYRRDNMGITCEANGEVKGYNYFDRT
jgi:hypothetical protein